MVKSNLKVTELQNTEAQDQAGAPYQLKDVTHHFDGAAALGAGLQSPVGRLHKRLRKEFYDAERAESEIERAYFGAGLVMVLGISAACWFAVSQLVITLLH